MVGDNSLYQLFWVIVHRRCESHVALLLDVDSAPSGELPAVRSGFAQIMRVCKLNFSPVACLPDQPSISSEISVGMRLLNKLAALPNWRTRSLFQNSTARLRMIYLCC